MEGSLLEDDDEPVLISEPRRDWRLFNVVLLGVSFLFLFTAFNTCSMVEVCLSYFQEVTNQYALSHNMHKSIMPNAILYSTRGIYPPIEIRIEFNMHLATIYIRFIIINVAEVILCIRSIHLTRYFEYFLLKCIHYTLFTPTYPVVV
jgi:hypothetical protein